MGLRDARLARQARGRRGWRALALACAAGLLAPASAAAGERADYSLTFAERAPATPTALRVHILYKRPGDPQAKPVPLRGVVLAAPAGTRFALDAVPVCEASDAELRARAAQACPPATRVGGGTFTAVTGFGPPADPVVADATVFNAPGGFVELVTDRGSGRTLGFDRARVEGSTATLAPPTTPGGPPEGETAVREIDIAFDVPAYVITPPSCPADGVWRGTGTFAFSDGVTVTEPSATPCVLSAPPAARAPRLVIRPGRLEAGRRSLLRVHVRGAAPACRRDAVVRVGRARGRTDATGRAKLAVRPRAGRYAVVVRRAGCPTVRGTLRAR